MTRFSGDADHGGGAGVIRTARLQAVPGKIDALVVAARANASEAREADGCLTADVVRVPGEPGALQVISRWRSEADLRAFLDWHEGIAHRLIAEASATKPVATHFPIV